MRADVEQVVDDLLGPMAARGDGTPVDLVAEFAVPLPMRVVCDLLGVPPGGRAALKQWADRLLAPRPGQVPRARDTLGEMAAIVTDLVSAKRAHPGDNLASALVAAASEGGERLSRDELTSMLFYLLFVWYEVSVDLLSNGILTLLRHPDQFAALRADSSGLARAVEELLRHETPQALATPRFPLEDIQIADVTIPAGDTVLLALAAANRDPHNFAAPEHLDLTRPAAPHLSFGAGIHTCVGAPLVRLQTSIALSGLLERFPDMRLAVDPGQLRWREGIRHRGVRELPVLL
jgi:cytochrome P450